VSLNAELKGSSRAIRLGTYVALGKAIVSLLRRVPIRDIDASQIPANVGRPPAQ